MPDTFFTNKTDDVDNSKIIKNTGNDNYKSSDFQVKITGVFDGATCTPQYDYNDKLFAPLLNTDGVTPQTQKAVGILVWKCKPGCGMKILVSNPGENTSLTAKRI